MTNPEIRPLGEQEIPHSPYYETAISEFIKNASDKAKAHEQARDLVRVLDSIDKQGVNNLSQFRPTEHPGIAIPYTRVSINQVAHEAFPPATTPPTHENAERYLYINIGGIAHPPAGHPYTAWDMIYDRSMIALGRVMRPSREGEQPPKIAVVSVGSPNGAGGKVDSAWLDARKEHGLSVYGKTYAELVGTLDHANGENTKIIINGMSLGSSITKELSRYLPDDIKDKTQYILDNPVDYPPKKIFSLLKALQIPMGFLGEGITRSLVDPRLKHAMKMEKPFLQKLQAKLRSKGIPPDDKEQETLKKKAFMLDAKDLIRGTDADTEDTRMYIRRGIKDPTTFSPLRLARTLLQVHKGQNAVESRGEFLEFAVNESHFINRYRNNWGRIIERCKPSNPISTP